MGLLANVSFKTFLISRELLCTQIFHYNETFNVKLTSNVMFFYHEMKKTGHDAESKAVATRLAIHLC